MCSLITMLYNQTCNYSRRSAHYTFFFGFSIQIFDAGAEKEIECHWEILNIQYIVFKVSGLSIKDVQTFEKILINSTRLCGGALLFSFLVRVCSAHSPILRHRNLMVFYEASLKINKLGLILIIIKRFRPGSTISCAKHLFFQYETVKL